jgi:hypothetical protein
MTNTEYKELIEDWTTLINDSGITLSDKKPVPVLFWKTFFGITRSVHVEIMNGTYRRKEFSSGLAQTIRFAKRLEPDVFIEEVKAAIPLFEANKRK